MKDGPEQLSGLEYDEGQGPSSGSTDYMDTSRGVRTG
jgi:hypothetical protein